MTWAVLAGGQADLTGSRLAFCFHDSTAYRFYQRLKAGIWRLVPVHAVGDDTQA